MLTNTEGASHSQGCTSGFYLVPVGAVKLPRPLSLWEAVRPCNLISPSLRNLGSSPPLGGGQPSLTQQQKQGKAPA